MSRIVYKKDSIHPLSWELEEIKTALGINFTWFWERLGLTWKLGLHDISFANGRTWVDMKNLTRMSRLMYTKASAHRLSWENWRNRNGLLIEAFRLRALIGVPWKLELLYRTWWAPVLLSLVGQIWIWSSVAGSLAENVLLRLNMHWVDQLSGDAADVHFIFQTNSAPVEIFWIELGKISLNILANLHSIAPNLCLDSLWVFIPHRYRNNSNCLLETNSFRRCRLGDRSNSSQVADVGKRGYWR